MTPERDERRIRGDTITLAADGQGLTIKCEPIRYPVSGEQISVIAMTIADLRRVAKKAVG